MGEFDIAVEDIFSNGNVQQEVGMTLHLLRDNG